VVSLAPFGPVPHSPSSTLVSSGTGIAPRLPFHFPILEQCAICTLPCALKVTNFFGLCIQCGACSVILLRGLVHQCTKAGAVLQCFDAPERRFTLPFLVSFPSHLTFFRLFAGEDRSLNRSLHLSSHPDRPCSLQCKLSCISPLTSSRLISVFIFDFLFDARSTVSPIIRRLGIYRPSCFVDCSLTRSCRFPRSHTLADTTLLTRRHQWLGPFSSWCGVPLRR